MKVKARFADIGELRAQHRAGGRGGRRRRGRPVHQRHQHGVVQRPWRRRRRRHNAPAPHRGAAAQVAKRSGARHRSPFAPLSTRVAPGIAATWCESPGCSTNQIAPSVHGSSARRSTGQSWRWAVGCSRSRPRRAVSFCQFVALRDGWVVPARGDDRRRAAARRTAHRRTRLRPARHDRRRASAAQRLRDVAGATMPARPARRRQWRPMAAPSSAATRQKMPVSAATSATSPAHAGQRRQRVADQLGRRQREEQQQRSRPPGPASSARIGAAQAAQRGGQVQAPGQHQQRHHGEEEPQRLHRC